MFYGLNDFLSQRVDPVDKKGEIRNKQVLVKRGEML